MYSNPNGAIKTTKNATEITKNIRINRKRSRFVTCLFLENCQRQTAKKGIRRKSNFVQNARLKNRADKRSHAMLRLFIALMNEAKLTNENATANASDCRVTV